jgi:branched-chain amino acid transport system substrate-binding protein
MKMKHMSLVVAGALSVLVSSSVLAQAKEQFVGLPSYRVGAYAAGGTGVFGGYIDYMQLVNEQGGINGVKFAWEECETEYNNARGVECYERLKKKGATGNTVFMPLSTGITYSVLDKVPADQVPMVTIGYGRTDATIGSVFPWVFPMVSNYLSGNTIKIKYIADKEGGFDKLKGKKIVNLYHDSAYGKETLELLDIQAKKYGFTLVNLPVAHPGNDQQSHWQKIRSEKPDWVILRGWGVMNPVALKTAKKNGFPVEKIVGVWWSGSEEDTVPAGDAAKGFTAAAFTGVGTAFPVIQNIQKMVYGKQKGNMEDKTRVGSVFYNRGVVHGIITVEAIKVAQEKYGKGKPMTGEQMRWGFEHLNFDAKRLKELGAEGLMPTMKITCNDHEGSGQALMIQWDGKAWKTVSKGWVEPDKSLTRPLIEASAAKYAKEKGITPRDCSKES